MQAKLLLLDSIEVKNHKVDAVKTCNYSMPSSIQKYLCYVQNNGEILFKYIFKHFQIYFFPKQILVIQHIPNNF